MILFNILQQDAVDNLFAVWNRLVGQDLSSLCLVVHRVSEHGLRDLVSFDFSDPLPVEFVRLGQTDILSFRACQEHQRLHDLWVAHNTILKQVLYHTQPLLILEEPLGDHLESLVLCFDFTKLIIDRFRRYLSWLTILILLVWIDELLLEVVGVLFVLNELKVFNFLSDLLGSDSVVGSGILCILLLSLI